MGETELPALQRRAEETLSERLAGWQERYPDVHVRHGRPQPSHASVARKV
jgi:hypothetical protein